MDWIKKNYDQFTLALFAILLIAVTVMLFNNVSSFSDQFAAALAAPSKSTAIPNVDTARIDEAREHFEKPTLWTPRKSENGNLLHSGLLFTSEMYYVNQSRQLEAPKRGSLYKHSRTGEPIDNQWFMDFSLPLLDTNVPFGDPDGDGFLNEDEWLGKTDPNNKDSHPPYYTQLFLKNWLKQAFRLKFQAYDGDPKKDKPEDITFQINPLDAGARSQFRKLGEMVEGTKFKVVKFEFKEVPDPNSGTKEVSELTVVNTETGDNVVLIYNKVVDSPNQFAQFEYFWNKKHGEAGQVFVVPKLKEFVLQPNIDQKYKLLDVNEAGALIQRPDGEKYQVPLVKK
jgi:hypothetical protein